MNTRSLKFCSAWIIFGMILTAVVYLEISAISSVHTISGYSFGKIPSVMVYFIPCVLTGMAFYKILSMISDSIYGCETESKSEDTVMMIPKRKALYMFLCFIIPVFMFFFASNLHLIKSGKTFCSSLTISGAAGFVMYLLSVFYEDRFPVRNGRLKTMSLILSITLTIAGWWIGFGTYLF